MSSSTSEEFKKAPNYNLEESSVSIASLNFQII